MKIIDQELLDALSAEARGSARRRRNHNLHPRLDDPVQRLFNALEPGTYIRPHRHVSTDQWELFLVLRGAVDVVTFDDAGRVLTRHCLSAGGRETGVELSPDTWHSLVATSPGTMVFEVKPGPYEPLKAKDFAPWAPAEEDPGADAFMRWLEQAVVGSRAP